MTRWMTEEQVTAHQSKFAAAPKAGPTTPRTTAPVLPANPVVAMAGECLTAAIKSHAGRRKYGNVPTQRNGFLFDSIREANYDDHLRLGEKAGEIRNIRRQVQYELIPRQDGPDGKCLCRRVTYFADHVFEERTKAGDWITVVADAKGYRNDRWPMKRALMLAVHKILVREV